MTLVRKAALWKTVDRKSAVHRHLEGVWLIDIQEKHEQWCGRPIDTRAGITDAYQF